MIDGEVHDVADVHCSDVSTAWLTALERVVDAGGRWPNLVVRIDDPVAEDACVRVAVDAFIDRRRQRSLGPWPVETVANTLFPRPLYRPGAPDPAGHLYRLERTRRRVRRRCNPRGDYFERMVAWPGVDGPVNQLDAVIRRLTKHREAGRRNGTPYEIALAHPEFDAAPSVVGGDAEAATASLQIYAPGRDNSPLGFPCLSHVSLSLFDGRLHAAAVYRNHHFLSRAYGNYLGLGRLAAFVAEQSGVGLGSLVCVSSTADAEYVKYGKRAVTELVTCCRAAASTTAGAVAAELEPRCAVG